MKLLSVVAAMLLALLTVPPVFSDTSAEARGAKNLSITIEGPVSSELAPVAGQLTQLFYECYPKLLERFENIDKAAPRHVKLQFKTEIKVPGYSQGDTVVVSVEWLKQHPQDIGLFTHELTHLVQAYPSPEPGWLTEGIADYARAQYGPSKQPGWELPMRLRPDQSYKNGYGVTARFLVWLDSKHPGVVDQLHGQMQRKSFEIDEMSKFTGKDVDTLWRECVKELENAPQGK